MFTDKEDFICPPTEIEGKPIKCFCESPFLNSFVQAVDITSNLVSVAYCTFHNIVNLKSDNKGGAVYIFIEKSMETYNEPIRIYHSSFTYCQAKYGSAIYIESYQEKLKFDFLGVYIGENSYNQVDLVKNDVKGGGIFIATSYSNFEFRSCSFDRNNAGDGAAIYYISDTSNSLEVDETINDEIDHDLYFVDCHFYFNMAYSNGGGLFISLIGREHLRPIQLENCIFFQSYANDQDGDSTDPDHKPELPENGGAIYYSTSYTKLVSSSRDYNFRAINCDFNDGSATFKGAGFFISIEKEEPSKSFEIDQCTFLRNRLMGDKC